MTWRRRHALRRNLTTALWPIPLACMIAAILAARFVLWLDSLIGWTLNLNADVARNIGIFLAGTLLSFIVFIFSVLLVTVQLASAQFTPRVIARMFMDPFTRVALGIFVFVYTYSLVVLLRLTQPVTPVRRDLRIREFDLRGHLPLPDRPAG